MLKPMGKINLYIGLIALCGTLMASYAAASNLVVRFEVQPEVLHLGETAEIVLAIQGLEQAIAAPTLPAIDGLRFGTPSTEHSTSASIIDGRAETRRTITFRWHVMPLRQGEYRIGPYGLSLNGNELELPERKLRVLPRTNVPGSSQDKEDLSELVFATITADREEVYVHESFVLYLSIYSRGVNIGRDVNLSNMPQTGLALQRFEEIRPTREVVDNRAYEVRRFQAHARALSAGTLVFEPGMRVPLLVQRSSQQRRDFMSGFFSSMDTHPIDLKLDPLRIPVRALPDKDRPASFSGGVGEFNFDLVAQPKKLQAGDPITLNITIAGSGNIETVSAPRIEDSDHFRVYPARLINQEINNQKTAGRKLYEQIIMPRTDSVEYIPPLVFSYFDPKTANYKTIRRGPIPLQVSAGNGGPGRMVRGDTDTTDPQTRILGADIRYLKPMPDTIAPAPDRRWFEQPVFWGLQALPPVLVLAVFLIALKRHALQHDVARARREKAPRVARSGLRKAEQALKAGERAAYFDALWTALTAYFGHRFNLAPGAVESDAVCAALARGGLPEEQVTRFRTLFQDCEQNRYASASAQNAPITDEERAKLSANISDAGSLLKQCERVAIS